MLSVIVDHVGKEFLLLHDKKGDEGSHSGDLFYGKVFKFWH